MRGPEVQRLRISLPGKASECFGFCIDGLFAPRHARVLYDNPSKGDERDAHRHRNR